MIIKEEQIRKNIRYEINTSGIPQRTIAKKLNITPQALNNYLKKDTMPALDTFANLCLILDLDANEVLGIEDERKRQNKGNFDVKNINIFM